MTHYDPIDFPFQVHNDAEVPETTYLVPDGLPWGANLEITPRMATVPPGQAVVFRCRVTLDPEIIRPGCTNDQGFRLTAWRVAQDAHQDWGSCFYFLRPRVRTIVEITQGEWYEKQLSVHGRLTLDTDQSVDLASQLPLRVRVRFDSDQAVLTGWHTTAVQTGGTFSVQRTDASGPPGAKTKVQIWFDRTDLLGSSRSTVRELVHAVAPVIH